MSLKKVLFLVVTVLFAASLFLFAQAKVDLAKVPDGTYLGNYKATYKTAKGDYQAKVTVAGGKLTKVVLTKCAHSTGPARGKAAYDKCLDFLNKADNVGYLWCRLFRKDIIDKSDIRFVEEYVLWEDLDFIFRYLIHTESSVVQKDVCYHYLRPDFGCKYLGKQYTMSSLKCLRSVVCCYVSLTRYNNSALLVSLANQYINCMIHICRSGTESYHIVREYSRFVKMAIKKSQCMNGISLKSKMFLTIDSLPSISLAAFFNKIIWTVLRKRH